MALPSPTSTVSHLADAVRANDVPRVRALVAAQPELVHMDMAGDDEHRALHYAVLARNPVIVTILMEAGADARKGIYPHRVATSAYTIAYERGYEDIVRIIEEQEQHRREAMSCPNATVSPVQDQINNAIVAGKNDDAIHLLEADPTLIKACDREGGSPLHIAAGALNDAMVAWLLDHHANVTKTDMKGLTPLDRAVMAVDPRNAGSLEKFPAVAHRLRSRGSPMSVRSAIALGDAEYLQKMQHDDPQWLRAVDGFLPVTLAVRHDRMDMINLLLDLGCNPDDRIRLGGVDEEIYSWGSPLWYAALMKRHDMAELLLKRKADPNAKVYASGGPLSQAFSVRDEQMKSLLRAHGAKDDPATVGLFRDTEAAIKLLDEHSANPDLKAWDGQTLQERLLWAAACGGDPEIVRRSLQRIDWPREDPRWHSMLDQPLRFWNHGPGFWVHRNGSDMDRSTYSVCFKLILDRCDPNIMGRFGERMLHSVIAFGDTWGQRVMTEEERLVFAGMLLDAGGDLNVRDDLLRSTPLAWAVRWGRREVAELFIQRGARVNEPDAEHWATPLAWSHKMKREDLTRLLASHGAQ